MSFLNQALQHYNNPSSNLKMYLVSYIIFASTFLPYTLSQHKNKVIYSTYQSTDFFSKRNFEVVPNNFLKNLAIFSKCLVHIINNEGIDLNYAGYYNASLVLSRLDVIRVELNHFRPFLVSFESIKKIRSSNKTLTMSEWITHRYNTNGCTYIDFALKTKPWYCEAHIYLFPPDLENTHFYNLIYKQQFLLVPIVTIKFWQRIPHTLQSVKKTSLLLESETKWRFDVLVSQDNFKGISNWAKSLSIFSYSYVTLLTSTWELFHWIVIEKTIDQTDILCHHCHPCIPFKSYKVKTKYLSSMTTLKQFVLNLNF